VRVDHPEVVGRRRQRRKEVRLRDELFAARGGGVERGGSRGSHPKGHGVVAASFLRRLRELVHCAGVEAAVLLDLGPRDGFTCTFV
jgi:hypothetical protein